MASPSTWKNVFSQHLLLKSLRHKILAMGAAPTTDHATEIAPFSPHGKLLPPFPAHLCTGFETSNRSPERGGPKLWSGPLLHRRHSKMQNVSLRRQYPSNTLPPMLNFLWPLTPNMILISEGSYNKNQETIGGHLDSFHAN
jgi:hypothetical protein